jgi:hypothetical protein
MLVLQIGIEPGAHLRIRMMSRGLHRVTIAQAAASRSFGCVVIHSRRIVRGRWRCLVRIRIVATVRHTIVFVAIQGRCDILRETLLHFVGLIIR